MLVYPLSSVNAQVQQLILTSSLKDFEKIALHNMAVLLFKDVIVKGSPIQAPVVVIDTMGGDSPAMIVVFRFVEENKADDCTYTFQFEVWPTDKYQIIEQPIWYPKAVTQIPTPRMKLSFLAERNNVVYYERMFEGTFKDTLKQMAQALGR